MDRAVPCVKISMKRILLTMICLTLMVCLMPVSAFGMTLAEASNRAARMNNAKVLSAKTVKVGNTRVHHIKLLTKKGVVKTVKIADDKKAKKH